MTDNKVNNNKVNNKKVEGDFVISLDNTGAIVATAIGACLLLGGAICIPIGLLLTINNKDNPMLFVGAPAALIGLLLLIWGSGNLVSIANKKK